MISKENSKLIDGAIRNIQCDGKHIHFSHHAYTPIYSKGDIVYCEFVGIGRELDSGHYAIVWSAKSNSENINVIPLTSKLKDESKGEFNLGKIDGFYTKDEGSNNLVNKDSFVYLDKLMEVSRKRVRPVNKQNNKGTYIKDTNGNKIKVAIDKEHTNRIIEGFKLFYLDEGTCLFDLISKKIDIKYQYTLRSINDDLLKIGYRLVESYAIYDINSSKVLIFHVNKKRYSITFNEILQPQKDRHSSKVDFNLYSSDKIRWNKNILSIRNEISKALFSGNNEKINSAKNILTNFWK